MGLSDYACVIVGLVTIVSLVYWFVPGGARSTYRGPVEEVVVTNANEDYAHDGAPQSKSFVLGESAREIDEVKG